MVRYARRRKGAVMERPDDSQSGRVKPAILLWALGVPIPIVILILLLTRGC